MTAHYILGKTIELDDVTFHLFCVFRSCFHGQAYCRVTVWGRADLPIRSLIESGYNADKRSDDIFKAWESPGVTIVPVFSQPDDSWGGEAGYVRHDASGLCFSFSCFHCCVDLGME
ncbi:hypothetical protein L1987_48268 [Smallanthus sonchifolius]|uniref:Uncharacterized protein n=1 Tax=Smallanthus sonchifolius TaxID=185202 RepID=A0ACB9FRK3_9ASTR|nr:hypothetical protein L1987_48268 [Smallanthus sonchifolius]